MNKLFAVVTCAIVLLALVHWTEAEAEFDHSEYGKLGELCSRLRGRAYSVH